MRIPPALSPEAALFLDVDGTLLEIAPDPDQVSVPRGLPGLLQRLAAQRGGALALISGRPLAELDQLFRPWHGPAAGLHGIERRSADGRLAGGKLDDADLVAAQALDRIRPELIAMAGRWRGVWLEDKGRTLGLHYRAAPEAGVAIRDGSARLLRERGDGLRLISGKMVVEFQPHHHDKGRVIAAFMAEPPFRQHLPVFVGDDTTDEDGFAEVNRQGGLSIRVGPHTNQTMAEFGLPSVGSVLDWLAASRAGSGS